MLWEKHVQRLKNYPVMSPAQKFSNSPSPARVESSAALAAQGVSARKEFGVDPHADGESSNFRDDASRPSAAPAGDLGAKGSSSHLVGSFRKLNPYPSIYTAQEIIYNASILFLHGAIYQLPSLPQLHAWISEHWEPLIMEEVGDALADFLMASSRDNDLAIIPGRSPENTKFANSSDMALLVLSPADTGVLSPVGSSVAVFVGLRWTGDVGVFPFSSTSSELLTFCLSIRGSLSLSNPSNEYPETSEFSLYMFSKIFDIICPKTKKAIHCIAGVQKIFNIICPKTKKAIHCIVGVQIIDAFPRLLYPTHVASMFLSNAMDLLQSYGLVVQLADYVHASFYSGHALNTAIQGYDLHSGKGLVGGLFMHKGLLKNSGFLCVYLVLKRSLHARDKTTDPIN
ncbi:hypothetical protein SUGI_0119270 [Cryptomeria japonica]|nr:hypothetical protein SUGI_0119270 [Cryptomeria japonica]